MTLKFERNLEREEHGRSFTPEKWKDEVTKLGPTLAQYFKPDADAPPAPEGNTVKLDSVFFSQYTPYADGKLRALAWEENEDGSRNIETVLDYETCCETVDVWTILTPNDVEEINAAVKVMKAAAEDSATSYHYESIEGDYELFDAFETDWLMTQKWPGRHWTRAGLLILLGFLERIDDEEIDFESEFDLSPETVASAHRFCELLGISMDTDLSPNLSDFYC